MNDQHLERALRAGPPFATGYQPRALPLDPAVLVVRVPSVRRLLLVALALLLAAAVAILATGSRRVVLLGLSCADAGRAVAATTRGWTGAGFDLALADDAGAGMLAAADATGTVVLVDAGTGAICATIEDPQGRRVEVRHAKWSPDGGAFAFVVSDAEREGPWDLVVLSRDGLATSALRSDRPIDFSWSPDSRSIAAFTDFITNTATPVEVWVVAEDGGEPKPMTLACAECGPIPEGWASRVAWSPDGTRIALAFLAGSGLDDHFSDGYDLWIGTVAGSVLAPLEGERVATMGGWLDDRTVVARRAGPEEDPGVWIAIDADSGAWQEVSTAGREFGVSPDGRYRLETSGTGSILLYDLVAGGLPALVHVDPPAGPVIWSADSRGIAFTTPADGELPFGGVWVAGVEGAEPRRIADAGLILLHDGFPAPDSWQPVSTIFDVD